MDRKDNERRRACTDMDNKRLARHLLSKYPSPNSTFSPNRSEPGELYPKGLWGASFYGCGVDKTAAFFEMGLIRLQVAAALLPLSEHLGVFARHLFNERRLRDRAFDSRLFGEPGWDILLDLFASDSEEKPVSASSAALAASVPATSGLRYLARLEKTGLIARTPGRHRRSVIIGLTQEGRERMAAILTDMLSSHVRATGVHKIDQE